MKENLLTYSESRKVENVGPFYEFSVSFQFCARRNVVVLPKMKLIICEQGRVRRDENSIR